MRGYYPYGATAADPDYAYGYDSGIEEYYWRQENIGDDDHESYREGLVQEWREGTAQGKLVSPNGTTLEIRNGHGCRWLIAEVDQTGVPSNDCGISAFLRREIAEKQMAEWFENIVANEKYGDVPF